MLKPSARKFVCLRSVLTSAALLIGILASVSHADAAFDRSLSQGKARITTPGSMPAQCTAVLLAVGTAMSNRDYDTLASHIAAYGYVIVVLDHQPGSLTKTNATKLRNLVLAVKSSLPSWVSPGCGSGFDRWLLGGHSAGGQAAHSAMLTDSSLASAVFSVDPYNLSGLGTISKPGLYWGFNSTTCFVDVNAAGKAAYNRTPSATRVFHRVDTSKGWQWCGYVPHYSHCSFTNGGCPGCSSCVSAPQSFYNDVAQSVNRFVNALASGNWAKSNLTLVGAQTPVTTFTGSEQP
ncbi:MAG: hypothetical protein V4812_14740 [Pseudomonadota bacterium]